MSGEPDDSAAQDNEGEQAKESAEPGGQAAQAYSYDSAVPDSVVHADVKARNAFVNSTFNGPVILRDATGDPLLSVERSALAAQLSENYIATELLARIQEVLPTAGPVLAVCGPAGAGKSTACLVALHRGGHPRVVEVPADLALKDLLRNIKAAREVVGNASFLLRAADAEFVERLDDFQLEALAKELGRSLLLITSNGTPAGAGEVVLRATIPAAGSLLDAYVAARSVDTDVASRAKRLIGPLDTMDYGTLDALVERIIAQPDAPDADLVAGLSDRSALDALDAWFVNGRSAREVATLACVATCDGGPRIDIDQQILRMESQLVAGRNGMTDGDQQLFGIAAAVGTKGVVVVGTDRFRTHFGWQREDVYRLEMPLMPQVVITYLWNHLGADFREVYIKWLRTVASARHWRLRLGASLAAGVLLCVDPRSVEQSLIRNWARSTQPALVEAASIALGVPTVLNEPVTVGRQLANSWIRSDIVSERCCAILAYGGPLGAWDPGCGGPARLWRESSRAQDGLDEVAAHSLANLCVAGPAAAQTRFAVLSLLADQSDGQLAVRRRALAIFAVAVKYLTMPRTTHRESFLALLDPTEASALDAFGTLLARSWSLPLAKDAGQQVLHNLVACAELHTITFDVLLDLMRKAKAVSRMAGTAPELARGLRRALVLEVRKHPDDTVAQRLLDRFFPDLEVKV